MVRSVEQDTPELTELERENDLILLAAGCNEALDPSAEATTAVKTAVCESHIGTLQKLWLPAEYTELQSEAYKQAEEHFAHRRSDEAQGVIYEYEQFLLSDPGALEIRRRATEGLRDKIDPMYRDEFDMLIGYQPEAAAAAEETVITKSIQIVRTVGAFATRGAMNVRQAFAK